MPNCQGCKNLHEAHANGYCEVFSAMPQIGANDECMSHTKHLAAKSEGQVTSIPNKPTGEYLHLGEIPIKSIPAAKQ